MAGKKTRKLCVLVISSCLGTSHYLSPWEGAEDFRGDHLIFGTTKVGISHN